MITNPIKPEKEKAWHSRSHAYFTKQASNVVSAYITEHTQEGDTVLDPFGGTGVTAIEALTLKRKVILLDINPLACFIAKQTCEQVNTHELEITFHTLKEKVGREIEHLYTIPNEELAKNPVAHWYPKNIPLPKNADFAYVHELYTPRQLHSYALLFSEINKIEDSKMKNMMKYAFSSTMNKVNLTYMENAGNSGVLGFYRYWKPSKPIELNVNTYFQKRFENILKGKEKWNTYTEDIPVSDNLRVIHGSVLELSKHVEEKSIDYIYTDPPYGANIAYLDLSTMWNAWLFPEILENQNIDSLKKEEVIEGGELEKTQAEYTELMTKSFEQMGKVLKIDRWMSCVFAHKKLEFWNVIIDACEDNGMEFKGSTYQPTNNSSIHYKKNIGNVLCSQRIANFKKTFYKSIRPKPDDIESFIFNEMERAILETNGASIDNIYQRVLDRLLQTKSMGEAKKKGYLHLDKYLEDPKTFVFDTETNLYHLKNKTEKHRNIEKAYMEHLDQLRIYVKELLSKHKNLTLDEIHKHMFEIFSEDKKFPLEKDLPIILADVAVKGEKSGKWMIRNGEAIPLNFTENITKKLVKVRSNGSHSGVIYRLVKIGEYLGFRSWVGKREQESAYFEGIKLKELSIPQFPITQLTEYQKNKIQQIDVIWVDTLGFPRYAFEVEESTSITSGFERFVSLLEVQHDISKKLFIICPQSRQKKINDVFKNSSYIGHPLYLENKVAYILKEILIRFYEEHTETHFKEEDIKFLSQKVKIDT